MFGKKQKKNVLLLDSFDQVREVTKSLLESGGYAVTAVTTVLDALKSLGEKTFDLIISEVEISGKGGFAFYQRVKNNKETAHIPFVFMTAYEPQHVLKEMRKGDILIPKPVKLSEFLKQISNFMERQRAEKQETPKTAAAQMEEEPMPKKLELNFQGKQRKKRKKRKTSLMQLPHDLPTRHFTDPQGLFHYRQVRSSFQNIFKAYKSGKNMKMPAINFPKLELEWQCTLLPESVAVKRPKPASEDEEFLDLITKDGTKEDEIIWDIEEESEVEEVDEDTDMEIEDVTELAEISGDEASELKEAAPEGKEVSEKETPKVKEAPELLRIQANIPEYQLPEQSSWYVFYRSSGALASSREADLPPDKVEEACQIVFPMAALCFQMLGENFGIEYMSIETQKGRIFFTNDSEEDSYGIAIAEPL